MARPTKWRRIEHIPVIPYFVPSDTNVDEIPANVLKLEELEAIRLKDLVGLEQGECAERMEVSRPTFQRILITAREKVADSLINGKMIRIEGGNFTRNICSIHCKDCGKEFIFTVREQEFYAEKGFSEPFRCKECRDARKNSRNKFNSRPRNN